jgi:HSP20 family molecular chaperone IbpA
MNTNTNRMLVTGIVALVAGLAIGVSAMEFASGKSNAAKPANVSGGQLSSTAAGSGSSTSSWDPFQQIRDMQLQMDKMFSQMSSRLRSEPQLSSIPQNPGYSLSLNVEDLKDRFVVHAFLPDTKASDVNVKLDNQTLKVDVTNEQTKASENKNAPTTIAEWGQYEQTIQLPAAVRAGQMKIDRHDHELSITIPKT